MQFEGKHFIVTGGASGIGLGVGSQLLAQGAMVTLIDISEQNLDKARARLGGGCSERLLCCVADCADSGQVVKAAGQSVARFGRLDGLVANAGIRMKSVPLPDLEEDVWDELIRVNLRSVFVTCKAAAPHLKAAGGGSIVTVASLSGHLARLEQTAYCASKAGAIQFSRALAVEMAADKVRVNSVCPGTVRTPMFEKALAQDGAKIEHDRIYGSPSRFRSGIPLRQIAEVEDVAGLIGYLLSDVSRHVTGQVIFVDGGESLL